MTNQQLFKKKNPFMMMSIVVTAQIGYLFSVCFLLEVLKKLVVTLVTCYLPLATHFSAVKA